MVSGKFQGLWPLSLKTVPQKLLTLPTRQVPNPPPYTVVPNRSLALSVIKPAKGWAPSLPPRNRCSTRSFQRFTQPQPPKLDGAQSSNTIPQPTKAPFAGQVCRLPPL